MGEVVGRGPRIKFAARRTGDLQLATEPRPLSQLSALMQRLEECGLVPVLDDGLVGGNAAIAASSCAPLQRHAKAGSIVVSRSGKDPGAPLCLRDWVLLTGFDPQAWAADYQSANEAARPTSDAPLHAARWVRAPRSGTAGRLRRALQCTGTRWQRVPSWSVRGRRGCPCRMKRPCLARRRTWRRWSSSSGGRGNALRDVTYHHCRCWVKQPAFCACPLCRSAAGHISTRSTVASSGAATDSQC